MNLYFDNCASTQVDSDIMDILSYYNTNCYYNPSALGSNSAVVSRAMQDSRLKVAKCIGAEKDEIIFTSGGTEANNIAVLGAISAKSGNIVLTACEHSSVYLSAKSRESDSVQIRIANCDKWGHIDQDHYLSLIDDNTILACMMQVNNNTGAINDIYQLCHKVKAINAKTIVMCDGVQAVGKLPVNVKSLGVDLYSLSGHKLHTTKGIGALYVKKNTRLAPILYGGSQEYGLRSGTENSAAIVSLGVAVEKACNLSKQLDEKYAHLRQLLLSNISQIDNMHINSGGNCVNNIVSLSFADVRAEVLVQMLEQYGIIIGTTSACSAKNSQSSRPFLAMQLPKEYLSGIVRISFSKHTQLEDVQLLTDKLILCVAQLRKTIRKK